MNSDTDVPSLLSKPIQNILWRWPNPGRRSIYTGVVTLVCIGVLYTLFGCSRDWVILTGLIVDIVGAIFVVIPDVPAIANHIYIGHLRELRRRLALDEPPKDIPTKSASHQALKQLMSDMVFEVDIPDSPRFKIDIDQGATHLHIKNGGPPVQLNLDIIRYHVQRLIEEEQGQFRRFGLYLLITGFALQFFGTLINQMPSLFHLC